MSNALRLPEHDESSRFSPGQLVADRFAVVRFLDRGGMGEVYEVEDRHLQNVHVALKVIAPEIAADPAASRRFEQEVLLARRVTHPNLCPIYDIARSTGPGHVSLFLTMKLLGGETLGSRLARPALIPPAQAISIFVQMAAGVGALHAAGVIHRDIKPGNVMLDSDGPDLCVSIMDFGLARLDDTETTMTSQSLVAGTPGYLAPELMLRQGPSQAADLFALGVVMHRVLAGERPYFNALTFCSRPTAALEQAEVPPLFIHTVKELLAEAPERRCAAFAALQAAIAAHASTGGWEPQVLPTVTAPRPISRRKFGVGAVLAAGAAAGAAVGGLAWKHEQVYNLLHPLPQKRFVALVAWPHPTEPSLQATMSSVVDAIGNELARAEAFDHDLLILPHGIGKEVVSLAQLNVIRDSLGANLVLAASAVLHGDNYHLLLRLLDPSANRTFRVKTLVTPRAESLLLAKRAVQSAAQVLDISRTPDDRRSNAGTDNLQAFALFQLAEQQRNQEDDRGLDEAIESYKRAIDLDPHYVQAQSRLGWAYLRYYGLHQHGGALSLAGENFRSAIKSNPDLADSHVGLASFLQLTGDENGRDQEVSKALALDPTNPHTLTYQADFYAEENRWNDAEAAFKRVASLRPNYWLAHNEWGAVLEDQGKYTEAFAEFRTASLLAPKSAFALKTVGSVYLRLGKLAEALNSLTTSYEMSAAPDTAAVLAELHRVLGKLPEAISFARIARDGDPQDAAYVTLLGDVLTSAAGIHLSEAAQCYTAGAGILREKLRSSPRNGPSWMLLALCQARRNPAEVTDLLNKAESFHADDIDSQFLKLRSLELIGQREEALAVVERCLQRGPTLFEIEHLPDLRSLRSTGQFQRLASSSSFGAEA